MRNFFLFLALISVSLSGYCDGLTVNVRPSVPNNRAELTIGNSKNHSQIVKINVSNNSNREDVVASKLVTVPADGNITDELVPIEGKKFSNEVYWIYWRGVGDLRVDADQKGYQIPFSEGTQVSVCQFPHGSVPAIDFCAPKGTKVYSARDGVVIWTVDKYDDGGNSPNHFDKANLVEIFHIDGSKALYTHLDKGSIVVQEGQSVNKGDLLGAVGLSGQTSGSHLHFHVTKLNSDFKDDFIEPKFITPSSQEIKIIRGLKVTREGAAQPRIQANSDQVATKQIAAERREGDKENEIAGQPREKTPVQNAEECGGSGFKDEGAKAVDCYGKNRYERAIELFKKHVARNKDDSLSLARLAISYTRLNRHEEAVPAYQNAIAKNWISYDFASLYARSLFAIGKKDEAIKWNRRALILAPECNDCRRDLAIQLKDTGKKQEALKLLKDYDSKRLQDGKKEVFQGLIMLIEDELTKNGLKN